MGYAEDRGGYFRARFKQPDGRYGTVKDANGRTARYATRGAAEKAADAEEAKVNAGLWRDPNSGRITFAEYVSRWYADQDLALSTMQNYRRHIEEHLLPEFQDLALADLHKPDVNMWAKKERERGYKPSSIKTWRGTLHLVLEDAVEEGLIDSNPAAVRRGRGKRAGRSSNRGPEKTVTTALGLLLIAERAALLSGRDDEFVAIVTTGYTGIRWGELVGLEQQYLRRGSLRIESQLYELDTGELVKCPPKDDSYRSIDLPDWLYELGAEHFARSGIQACRCHGAKYAFRGLSPANGTFNRPGAKLVDVARRAGVSTGTVSNALNRPDAVAEATRATVEAAIAELGYVRNGVDGQPAAHWRRSGFAAWIFQPATTGFYPRRAPNPAHPVPLLAEPWPGIPVRGRGAASRAESNWTPIARGLTPHGLRHSHMVMLDEFGTPAVLVEERFGHQNGTVSARYKHVSQDMRSELLDKLTLLWTKTLDARLALSRRSPVAALDKLLLARASDTGAPEPGQ